jgi:ABC-type dipeptide/oligopeptide/nickel transport system permease subunit
MRGQRVNRLPSLLVGGGILAALVVATLLAPEKVSVPVFEEAFLGPFQAPPMGTDNRGIPLFEYALQGAAIVALPAVCAGLVVMAMAVLAGLIRCSEVPWFDTVLQVFTELLGSLPRLVVILVVAVVLPQDWKSLLPIAVTWALLASPGAMDEAAATAGRLGGTRFVEALRAHGFSAVRIYLYHVIWLNLRAVIVRQGAEVAMQVVFLEIALSYLAVSKNQPSFTHAESTYSWATLLYQGYTALMGQDLMHSMFFGLLLVAMVAIMAQAFRISARAK